MISGKEMLAESQLSQKEKDKFWNYLPTQLDKRDLLKYLFHSAISPKAYGLNYDFINKLSFETISKAFGEHGIHFEERHNSKEIEYFLPFFSPFHSLPNNFVDKKNSPKKWRVCEMRCTFSDKINTNNEI